MCLGRSCACTRKLCLMSIEEPWRDVPSFYMAKDLRSETWTGQTGYITAIWLYSNLQSCLVDGDIRPCGCRLCQKARIQTLCWRGLGRNLASQGGCGGYLRGWTPPWRLFAPGFAIFCGSSLCYLCRSAPATSIVTVVTSVKPVHECVC